MALDSTAREANLRDSVKKFFVDNINRAEGVHLTFDKALAVPAVQGIEVNRWVSVNFGQMDMSDTVSMHLVHAYCCTRQDSEGFKLAQLRDKVVGYLTDDTADDGIRRIPLYKSNVTPWVQVGALMVFLDTESASLYATDDTKYKMIPFRLLWAAKI